MVALVGWSVGVGPSSGCIGQRSVLVGRALLCHDFWRCLSEVCCVGLGLSGLCFEEVVVVGLRLRMLVVRLRRRQPKPPLDSPLGKSAPGVQVGRKGFFPLVRVVLIELVVV